MDSSHLLFHFDNLSYFRNTENRSLVDKGVTYIGFHLNPYVVYQFHKDAQISGGLFIRHDFGNPKLRSIEPYFKFKYKWMKNEIIFGNLEGTTQHQMVEPLYDYELVVTDRTEHGAQIKRITDRYELETWIDWQRMIYPGDPFNEEFTAGLNVRLFPIKNENNSLLLNAQALTTHKAGEIDKSPVSNSMQYNFAYGAEYKHRFASGTEFKANGYLIYYEDLSEEIAEYFIDGLGQMANVSLKLHDYDFILTYWNSHQYQAPYGEGLYMSQGDRNITNPFFTREMIMLRIAFEKDIGRNLSLLSRNGLNYNIDHDRFDLTMETYLRWHFTNKKPIAIAID